jgi:single-strand DNA-binding protein
MYHSLTLVGNCGRDPEMKYLDNGKAVTKFSLAVSKGYGDKKSTLWFTVTCWEKLGETVNTYVRKGSKLLVVGELNGDENTGSPRIWNGKNGPGTSFEVTAKEVRFLSPKSDNGSGASEPTTEPVTEELPF